MFALLSYLFPSTSSYSYILGYVSSLGFSPLQFFAILFFDSQRLEGVTRNLILFDYLAVSLALTVFFTKPPIVFCVWVECCFLSYILRKWTLHDALNALIPIISLYLLFGVFSILPFAIFEEILAFSLDFDDCFLSPHGNQKNNGRLRLLSISLFILFVFLTFPAGLSLVYSFYFERAILILVIFGIYHFVYFSLVVSGYSVIGHFWNRISRGFIHFRYSNCMRSFIVANCTKYGGPFFVLFSFYAQR